MSEARDDDRMTFPDEVVPEVVDGNAGQGHSDRQNYEAGPVITPSSPTPSPLTFYNVNISQTFIPVSKGTSPANGDGKSQQLITASAFVCHDCNKWPRPY
jgi:hypothetical protein